MPLVYKDRVLETTVSTGIGSLSLAGAVTGCQEFSAAFADGDQLPYALWAVDANGNPSGDWETGIGQYTSSGDLLERLHAISSSNPISPTVVPTIAAKGTVSSISTSTPLTTNAPTGVIKGSRLVLFVSSSLTGITTSTLNTPDGWRLIEDAYQANGNAIHGFDRIADGTANDTPSLTSPAGNFTAVAQIYRLDGVDYPDFVDIASTVSWNDGNIDTTDDVLTFNVAENNSLQLAVFCVASGTSVSSWGANLTAETSHTTTKSLHIASAERDAGTIAAETVTFSGSTRKAGLSVCYKAASYGKVSLTSGTKRVICTLPAFKVKLPDFQLFTTAGTHMWVKPPGCKMVEVVLIGGGGGGGSGAVKDVSLGRSGGCGGGAGGTVIGIFDADDLGAVESIAVGSGGPGGDSQTVDSSLGNSGTAGGASTFSNLRAAGGALGGGGTTSNSSGGAGGGTASLYSQVGGAAGLSSNGGASNASGSATSLAVPTGGGAGAAISATPTISAAGSGGALTASTVQPNAVAGGAGGGNGTGNPGSNGNTFEFLRGLTIGTGGGGGAAITSGNGGAGGNGGNYGAGGGGGATANNGFDSGAGGNGASGAVMVISY